MRDKERTHFEARIKVNDVWCCVGFFDSPEKAARAYNKEAAKHGHVLNDIAPAFRRVRCGDGTITIIAVCGMCGVSLRIGKNGQAQHCGRIIIQPADLHGLPIEMSESHRKTVKQIKARVEREKQRDAVYQLREHIFRMMHTEEEVVYERGKPVTRNA